MFFFFFLFPFFFSSFPLFLSPQSKCSRGSRNRKEFDSDCGIECVRRKRSRSGTPKCVDISENSMFASDSVLTRFELCRKLLGPRSWTDGRSSALCSLSVSVLILWLRRKNDRKNAERASKKRADHLVQQGQVLVVLVPLARAGGLVLLVRVARHRK